MMLHTPLCFRRLLLLAFLLCTLPFALLALPVGATGNTWTVNDLGDTGALSCAPNAGAGGATCQLRDALNKAANGDTIAFSVTGTITVVSSLTVTHNVTIQ